jgi:hypothetical protein
MCFVLVHSEGGGRRRLYQERPQSTFFIPYKWLFLLSISRPREGACDRARYRQESAPVAYALLGRNTLETDAWNSNTLPALGWCRSRTSSTTPSASKPFERCAGQRVFPARMVRESTSSSSVATRPGNIARGTAASAAGGALTTWPGRRSGRVITSPLRTWILCLYFMGLNWSNTQIARERDLNKDDVQSMATQLREGIVDRKPAPILEGTVECDEVYVVAGH